MFSTSTYVARGDDAGSLPEDGVTVSWIQAITAALADTALQHVTVCASSGDYGTSANLGDALAHVQYPSSDPSVLAVGGRRNNGKLSKAILPYLNADFSKA